MNASRIFLLFAISTFIAGVAIAREQNAMDDACRKEVIELHQFFQDWNLGKLERTEDQFRRFSSVMADEFEIISPGGGRMARTEIFDRVRGGHGSSKGADFRIWIENYRSRPIGDGLLLVTYEEWQSQDGKDIGRVSTAVFRRESGSPTGVTCLHVHETWLPSEK